ncbi:MAG: flagellar export chaperone FlgN [Planctomycetota bacterium]
MTTATLDTQADLPRFLELLTRQRDLYRRLHALAESQQATLHDQGAEAMLAVLSQRQVFVDALGRLNAELEPFRADWQRFSAGLEESDRTQVRALVDDVDRLLAAVLQFDEQSKQALTDAQKSVGDHLAQVNRVGQARSAYGHNPKAQPTHPRFADQQG